MFLFSVCFVTYLLIQSKHVRIIMMKILGHAVMVNQAQLNATKFVIFI